MTNTLELIESLSGDRVYRIERADSGLVLVTDESHPERDWLIGAQGIKHPSPAATAYTLPEHVWEAAIDHATEQWVAPSGCTCKSPEEWVTCPSDADHI